EKGPQQASQGGPSLASVRGGMTAAQKAASAALDGLPRHSCSDALKRLPHLGLAANGSLFPEQGLQEGFLSRREVTGNRFSSPWVLKSHLVSVEPGRLRCRPAISSLGFANPP